MRKIIYGLFVLMVMYLVSPQIIGSSATPSADLSKLPEISQGADVHTLSSTYCRALWSVINKPEILGYQNTKTQEFKDLFVKSVSEFAVLLKRIASDKPIMHGAKIILDDTQITDPFLAVPFYFDKETCSILNNALTNMSTMEKHKKESDYDPETKAHINEIFVYTWKKVKEDPDTYLISFLIGLIDAAPTCIQGYSVRMLCSVHPPRQITVVKK